MIYGEKIRDVRMKLGISQKEMAKSLGVSQSYLCGIENQTKRPNGEVMVRLIHLYKVNICWLINGSLPIFAENIEDVIAENRYRYNKIPFEEILTESDCDAESIVSHRIETDDLAPEIKEKDVVFVDASVSNADEEGVYFFNINERQTLGKLKLNPQKHLICKNKTIGNGTFIYDSSVQCIGKVVGLYRKI